MAVDSNSGLAYLGMFAVVIVLAIVVPYLIKRTRQSVKAEFKPVREQWRERENATKMKNAADRVLVELVETSREISARMDTKIRILNTLIRDAERHIRRLEELHDFPAVDLHADEKEKDNADDDDNKKEASVIADGEKPQNILPDELAEDSNQAKEESIDGLPTLPQGPPVDIAEDKSYLSDKKFSEDPAGSAQSSDVNKKVLSMLNQGYDIAEVARQVGISRQEVSLIQHLNSI